MAHIRSYKTNAGIHWQVTARDASGRQPSRSFLDHTGALRFKRLIERNGWEYADDELQRRRGRPSTGPVPTVAEALADHIDNLSGVTDGTRARYRRIAARIADSRLGDLPVDIVRRDDVNRWVRDLGGTLSGKTITNWHSVLNAALERQVELGNLRTNPARKTRIGKAERRGVTFLTPDEYAQLYEHMPPYWRPLTDLLYSTGLRFGEATALQVRDLALDDPRPSLHVQRGWKFNNGGPPTLGPPKTKKGDRTVLLPVELVDTLRNLTEGRPANAFVFITPVGTPVSNGAYRKGGWLKALKAANLAKRPRIHDLRHSHVAALLAQGVYLPTIQTRLGHESITTTIDMYGHLAEDAQSVAAQAASLSLSPAHPELLAAQVSSQAGMSQAYPELEA